MIGFLRGQLAEKGNGYVIIDVNGVGYEAHVAANSGVYLAQEGEEVKLYTTMMVREDDVSLFGFTKKIEMDTFKKLITVNGVGAKAAISILSAFTIEQLQQAIVFEDVKTLTKANGIGKKTAERIVLELKDKFSTEGIESNDSYSDISEVGLATGCREEAITALMALGYTRGEAAGALSAIKETELTTEEYIKLALKKLF